MRNKKLRKVALKAIDGQIPAMRKRKEELDQSLKATEKSETRAKKRLQKLRSQKATLKVDTNKQSQLVQIAVEATSELSRKATSKSSRA